MGGQSTAPVPHAQVLEVIDDLPGTYKSKIQLTNISYIYAKFKYFLLLPKVHFL